MCFGPAGRPLFSSRKQANPNFLTFRFSERSDNSLHLSYFGIRESGLYQSERSEKAEAKGTKAHGYRSQGLLSLRMGWYLIAHVPVQEQGRGDESSQVELTAGLSRRNCMALGF
jgi:hypothetical protein